MEVYNILENRSDAASQVVNDNPVTSHMRRAAASSCAMQMHLVLQNTGEQRRRRRRRSRRCKLSLLVRFNSTGLLARPWYRRVDQTCLSFASSRLPRLSMHSAYRVECRSGGPLKTLALSLSNAFSRTSIGVLHAWTVGFSSLSYSSFTTHPLREYNRRGRLNGQSNFSDNGAHVGIILFTEKICDWKTQVSRRYRFRHDDFAVHSSQFLTISGRNVECGTVYGVDSGFEV